MTTIDDLNASQLAALVRSREVRAREATEAALRRIDRDNPAVGAVTFLDADAALDTADAIDGRLDRGEPVGPLAGVPTLVKDLYVSVPGWPSTLGGIPSLRDERVPDGAWSAYARAVTDADAVILGQTNSSSFGFRGVTDNALFGPTRNPFDLERNAGGSSGGSAAAVAAGIVPVAGASDAGGSIRIPSAWCNTFGFQPSAGVVPSCPRPLGFHLGPYLYEGPVTRTVADAELLMRSLASTTPRDPTSVPPRAPGPSSPLERGVEGLRIGYLRDFGAFPVASAVARVIDDAVATFADLGATVEPVEMTMPATHEAMTDMWLRAMGTLMLADFDAYRRRGIDLAKDPGVPEAAIRWAERAECMSIRELVADRVLRTAILDAMTSLHERYDLLVGPTVIALPVRNADDGTTIGPSTVAGVEVDPLIGWCPAYLTNFTGAPSASVPAGLADGLPVGMLVVGRRYSDGDVFAASAAFEEARPWAHLYPSRSESVATAIDR